MEVKIGRSSGVTSPGGAAHTDGDGVHHAHRGAEDARLVVVAALAARLDLAGVRRRSVDLDAIAGSVARQRGPVGADVGAEPVHVRGRDRGTSVDDALELEAHRRARAGLDGPHRRLEGLGRRESVGVLAQPLELPPEGVGDHVHHPAPPAGDRSGREERRSVVERTAEPEEDAGELRIRVGRVVHRLGHA